MTMDFEYSWDGSLKHITFEGLNGRESAGNLKNALELLKINNPMRAFYDRVKAGGFDHISDEEYSRIVHAVEFVSSLWRYPDAQAGEPAQSEMNVLMLLANAIEAASRQNAVISRQGTEGL